MECNREELRLTAGGEPSERALYSAGMKNSPAAAVAQRPRSESQVPIAEGFSHRAFRSDSAHALPGIFWSLPLSKHPTFRSVFLRTNRPSQALAGSRKCGREWGLFVPAPAALISSKFSFHAPRFLPWKNSFSSAWRFVLVPLSRIHPAPPSGAASGPGRSLFGLA
jgi:hypothetical protein